MEDLITYFITIYHLYGGTLIYHYTSLTYHFHFGVYSASLHPEVVPSLYIGAIFEGDTKKPFLANSKVRVSYRLRFRDREKGKIKSGHFVHIEYGKCSIAKYFVKVTSWVLRLLS